MAEPFVWEPSPAAHPRNVVGNSNRQSSMRTPLGQLRTHQSKTKASVSFADKENSKTNFRQKLRQQSTPLSVNPTTPRSILRSELGSDEDGIADESLLASPAVTTPSLRQQLRQASSTALSSAPTNPTFKSVKNKKMKSTKLKPSNRVNHTVAPGNQPGSSVFRKGSVPPIASVLPKGSLIATKKDGQLEKKKSEPLDIVPSVSEVALKDSCVSREEQESSTEPKKSGRAIERVREKDSKHKQHRRPLTIPEKVLENPKALDHPLSVAEEDIARNTKTAGTATGSSVAPPSAQSDWSSAASVLTKSNDCQPDSTPFTPGGVCLDLSSMFQNAQTTIRPERKRPLVPQTTEKVAKKGFPIAEKPLTTDISYKDDWADQQCAMFCNWLNYTFSPPEDVDSASNDTVGLRTLIVHRRMAAVRRSALELYHGSEMQQIRDKVYREIARGRIAIRADRDLHADLTMRNQIMNLLLGYNTSWLRLGLETMFGVVILPASLKESSDTSMMLNSSVLNVSIQTQKQPITRMKHALKQFIVKNVLSDSRILAKYTKGLCKVPSGKFETEYRAELRGVVLSRLVVLFCFLDRAKEANLLEKATRLFTNKAPAKSTRDVLLAFCRDFLKSEGDFVRHLARIGVSVTYRQEPVDELDFHVSNLATDLRDGALLGRLLEILTERPHKSLLRKLRLPAKSRLQKLHNVSLIMKKFRSMGAMIESEPHHIVDGHRQRVLQLMWAVVSRFCLDDLVDKNALKEEVARIEQVPAFEKPLSETEDEVSNLLLRWTQAVCKKLQRHHPTNFSQDFADGRTLCFLIHFYHPTLLREAEVGFSRKDGSITSIETEQGNFRLANARMAELGGLPQLIPICDSGHPPEKKSIVLCLAFLCERLLESAKELRAVQLLQDRFRFIKARELQKLKFSAASLLWKTWKKYRTRYYVNQQRKYGAAVLILESFVRKRCQRIAELRRIRLQRQSITSAAMLIQSHARGFLVRNELTLIAIEEHAATTIQALWRGYVDRSLVAALNSTLTAVSIIQRWWRYHHMENRKRHVAATRIQSVCRMFLAQLACHIDLLDIILVQAFTRRLLVLKTLQEFRHSAVQIQRVFRGFTVRARETDLQVQRVCESAATKVQASFRRFAAVQRYYKLQLWQRSCSTIQKTYRRWCAQKKQNVCICTAIQIQSFVRCARARSLFVKQKHSAEMMQSQWRAYKCQSAYRIYVSSAMLVQKAVRYWLNALAVARRTDAAIKIQCFCRVHLSTMVLKERARKYLYQQAAATCIQSHCRRFLCKSNFKVMICMVILLQCTTRRHLAKREAKHLRAMIRIQLRNKKLAIIIQSAWRMYYVQKRFSMVVSDAVLVQAWVRRYLVVRRVKKACDAVVTLQCFFRTYLSLKYLRKRRLTLNKERESQRKAATLIQAYFRGNNERNRLSTVNSQVLVIQTVFRRHHQQAHFRAMLNHICLIQRQVRGALARCRVETYMGSILIVQAVARGFLDRRKIRGLREEKASIRIQGFFRGLVARASFRRELGSVALQKTWRRYTARRRYTGLLRQLDEDYAALCVQQVVRGYFGRQLAKRMKAARTIQKTWRCYSTHVDYMLSFLSAGRIQTFARFYLAQREFTIRRNAALTLTRFGRMAVNKLKRFNSAVAIQRLIRGRATILALQRLSTAAVEIQRIFKGYRERIKYEWTIMASIVLQSAVRSYLAKSLLRRLAHNAALRSSSAIKIQRLFLRHRTRQEAVGVLERAMLSYLAKKSFANLRASVVSIQRIVRSHIFRKKQTVQVRRRYARLARATKVLSTNPQLRLGARTMAALSALKSRRLSEIMTAVCTLEMTTRYSRSCSLEFARAGAFEILLDHVRTFNRSLPHIEILSKVLLTMLNVVEYESTRQYLATSTGFEVLLDLVQMFRDKDHVFCLAVSLFACIVSCDEELGLLCGEPRVFKRLKSILAMCCRRVGSLGERAYERQSGPLFSSNIRVPSYFEGTKTLEHLVLQSEPNF